MRVWVTSLRPRPRELRAMVVVVTLGALMYVHVGEVCVCVRESIRFARVCQ